MKKDVGMDGLLDLLRASEEALAIEKGEDLNRHDALNKARETLPVSAHDSHRTRIALWIVAPCLAGFALWANKQIQRRPDAHLLGVMREGRMLAALMSQICGLAAQEIWINRDLALRMAFGVGDEEALLNWLFRTRLHPISEREALLQLSGIVSGDDRPIGDETSARALISKWKETDQLAPMRLKAGQLKTRFFRHWDHVLAHDNRPVFLVDFACAGNIQRSLRAVFLSEKRQDTTIGLNYMTTAGVQWAKKEGTVLHGFLAEAGAPIWFSQAYARTPELIEVFASAPLGALQDYDAKGTPLFAPSILTPKQAKWLAQIQPRIISAASHFATLMEGDIPAALCRSLWGRLLLRPTLSEATALGDWQLDAGMTGQPARLLAPACNDSSLLMQKREIAWPTASQIQKTDASHDKTNPISFQK